MRASRLVAILLLLQTRGRLTARQLAHALEVSQRTIYRDVEALQAAGVPLYGDAGPAGGYQVLGGYRTRLTGLSADEAEALFLAGIPGPAAELGFGSVMATAQLKLLAALPAGVGDRAARVAERFHLDAPGWYREVSGTPFLPAVTAALWEEHQLLVRYRRWKDPDEVTRTLEPHGVVLKAGTWYLVARSGGQMRTYRVSQILDLTPLEQPFSREEGFDLAGYWRAYLAEFALRRYQREAVVRLSREGRARVRHVLGAEAAEAVDATAAECGERGWVQARIPIESVNYAEGELLRLGAEVEVLAPDDLRDRLAATARALATLYQAGAAAAPPAVLAGPVACETSRNEPAMVPSVTAEAGTAEAWTGNDD